MWHEDAPTRPRPTSGPSGVVLAPGTVVGSRAGERTCARTESILAPRQSVLRMEIWKRACFHPKLSCVCHPKASTISPGISAGCKNALHTRAGSSTARAVWHLADRSCSTWTERIPGKLTGSGNRDCGGGVINVDGADERQIERGGSRPRGTRLREVLHGSARARVGVRVAAASSVACARYQHVVILVRNNGRSQLDQDSMR